MDFQNYAEYVDNASFADISVDINLAGEEGGNGKTLQRIIEDKPLFSELAMGVGGWLVGKGN